MKFGVREICDVVLKAKATQTIGTKTFYKNEPVLYFDTLKTSSMEAAATTVYAQGGKGNARLVSWDGERTVTFTMEDALISPESFMILSGAGLVEAAKGATLKQHVTETLDVSQIDFSVNDEISFTLENKPYLGSATGATTETADDYYMYVMLVKNKETIEEPYLILSGALSDDNKIVLKSETILGTTSSSTTYLTKSDYDSIIVDYYVEREEKLSQITITADSFSGNYYLEASTEFRTEDGVDMAAEFIIPNCRVQSNFTFSMASSGDPSTFTFTLDAFPDYTRFDHTQKVFSAIQILTKNTSAADNTRAKTPDPEA